MREVSLFRVWRLWVDGRYRMVVENDVYTDRLIPRFPKFNDLTKFLTEVIDVSRSKLYSRLRAYSLLDHLGYNEPEMVAMMSKRPSLYTAALNHIFVWDQSAREVKGMKTDQFGTDPYSQETIMAVRDFLEEIGNIDNINDALAAVLSTVADKRMFKIRYSPAENTLLVFVTDDYVDRETGEIVTGEAYETEFCCETAVHPLIKEELTKRFPAA
jgi:hypothetical protein